MDAVNFDEELQSHALRGAMHQILRERLGLDDAVISRLIRSMDLSVHGRAREGSVVALRLALPSDALIIDSVWTVAPGWLEEAVISGAHALANSIESDPASSSRSCKYVWSAAGEQAIASEHWAIGSLLDNPDRLPVTGRAASSTRPRCWGSSTSTPAPTGRSPPVP
jgi:hypothetical protein